MKNHAYCIIYSNKNLAGVNRIISQREQFAYVLDRDDTRSECFPAYVEVRYIKKKKKNKRSTSIQLYDSWNVDGK